MKRLVIRTLVIGAAGLAANVSLAQSPDYMLEDCRLASQQFYQQFEARSEAKYEGQRTDGTHAVNGTIYLENRSSDFQCSYNAAGDALVDFYADGKSWPQFVRGGGSPHKSGAANGTAAKPSVSTERVRFPVGQSSFQFPAQLPPGMTVRYLIGAKKNQFLDVRIDPAGAPLTYRILNPDGSALLDAIAIGTPYRGQLWQSGDHVVEVINGNGSNIPFDIYFAIE
jgi:hypothetical protein